MRHDYQVSVDNYDRDKCFTPPPDSLGGVRDYSVSCQYFFTAISHTDRDTIDITYANWDFSSFACDPAPPLVDIGSEVESKIQTFSEYGQFTYQIKGSATCSNMIVNVLPVDPPTQSSGMILLQDLSSVPQVHYSVQNSLMLLQLHLSAVHFVFYVQPATFH